MVGVNIEKMKNEEEKSEEKIIFVVVWLRREKREDFSRLRVFSPNPLKHILPKLGRTWERKGSKNKCPCEHAFIIL